MQKIIEQIHNEFESAGEVILQQAQDIVKKSDGINVDKIDRLKKLGFVNTREVKDNEATLLESKEAQELFDKIIYYSQKYEYKFITEDLVKSICNKYNLVCAPIKSYTGFVPEDQLENIEKCKVDDGDTWLGSAIYCGNHIPILDIEESDKYTNGLHIKKYPSGSMFPHDNQIQVFGEFEIIQEIELMICAPEKDFNTTGLTKKGKFLFNTKKIVYPDPVVLQSVKHGYLILATWGDEAEDPIVR